MATSPLQKGWVPLLNTNNYKRNKRSPGPELELTAPGRCVRRSSLLSYTGEVSINVKHKKGRCITYLHLKNYNSGCGNADDSSLQSQLNSRFRKMQLFCGNQICLFSWKIPALQNGWKNPAPGERSKSIKMINTYVDRSQNLLFVGKDFECAFWQIVPLSLLANFFVLSTPMSRWKNSPDRMYAYWPKVPIHQNLPLGQTSTWKIWNKSVLAKSALEKVSWQKALIWRKKKMLYPPKIPIWKCSPLAKSSSSQICPSAKKWLLALSASWQSASSQKCAQKFALC